MASNVARSSSFLEDTGTFSNITSLCFPITAYAEYSKNSSSSVQIAWSSNNSFRLHSGIRSFGSGSLLRSFFLHLCILSCWVYELFFNVEDFRNIFFLRLKWFYFLMLLKWNLLKYIELPWNLLIYLKSLGILWHSLTSLEYQWITLKSREIPWNWFQCLRIMTWIPMNHDLNA